MDANDITAAPDVCLECGAPYPVGGRRSGIASGKCWLCGASMEPQAMAGLVADRIAPGGGSTFTLTTIFLVMTLVAVCLGVATAAPGLAVPLVVIVTPALVRTFASSRRKKEAGKRLKIQEKVGVFFVSVAIMIMIAIAAGIAFFAACWIACGGIAVTGLMNNEAGIVLVFGAAGVAALAVVGYLFYKTWPGRNGRFSK